jgi:hypothetical protein
MYGHYGEDCWDKKVLPRKNILTLSEDEFRRYLQVLDMARNHPSDYVIVKDQNIPTTANIDTAGLNLYQLFIWLHHYAAKDNECERKPSLY